MSLFNVGEKYRNSYTIEHVVPFFDGELAISHLDSKRYYLQSAHLKKQAPSRAIQQYRSLNHPLVIPFTEVYTEDRSLVFIRPYCSIKPLHEVVMKEDIAEDTIVQWGKQLLLLAAELKTKAMPMYLLTDPRNIGLDEETDELKVLFCGVEHITALRSTLDWGTFFYSLVSKEHLEGPIDKVPNDLEGSKHLHRLIQKSLQNNSIDSILSHIEVYEKKRKKGGILDFLLGGGKKEKESSNEATLNEDAQNSSPSIEPPSTLPSRPEQIVGPEPTLADPRKSTDVEYLDKLRRELERKQQEEIERQRLQMELEMERQRQEFLKELEKERGIRERLEQERLKQKRLEQTSTSENDVEQESLEQESLEQESLEQESLEQERLEQERLEQERLEQERLEQERLERERLEQERLEQERLEQERLEQERLEQERLEQERLEQERLEQERLEQERLERERLEQERLERERLEQERLEQERLERERREWERRERERLKRELKEKMSLELEKLRDERLEWERREQERMEQARLSFENRERALIEKLELQLSQIEVSFPLQSENPKQIDSLEKMKDELYGEKSKELQPLSDGNSLQNLNSFAQPNSSVESGIAKQEENQRAKESEEHARLARQFEEYMKQMYKNN
ncbi:hypothetical protein [Hazenella coriacea]|uniref:Uncharacterized protein n=1 Tax=Hazenella coriacea TaxID=1179467 RepID=A0A4R3L620_9BACL|nr:hypothetical protein [Hazenella coriacea]TCS92829.1 hypothetical protein EDD58_11056 [Hazenella coriacea]